VNGRQPGSRFCEVVTNQRRSSADQVRSERGGMPMYGPGALPAWSNDEVLDHPVGALAVGQLSDHVVVTGS
jgi:hypothetical protein